MWTAVLERLAAAAVTVAVGVHLAGCPCSTVGCTGGVGAEVEVGRSFDDLVGGEVRLCRNDDCRNARIERGTIALVDGGTRAGDVRCSIELTCFRAQRMPASGGVEVLDVRRDIGFEHPDEEQITVEVTAPDGVRVGFRQGRVHYERRSVGCDGDCSGAALRL